MLDPVVYPMWEPTSEQEQEKRIKLLIEKLNNAKLKKDDPINIRFTYNADARSLTFHDINQLITEEGLRRKVKLLVKRCEQEVAEKAAAKAAEKAAAKAAAKARATTGINDLFPNIGRAKTKGGHNIGYIGKR